MWHCPYPICSACCVVLLLSYVQRLLCGIAPILFAAFVVWSCFYPMYSGCCVALPVSHLICSACCVVFLLSYVQRLLRGSAPILFTAPAFGVLLLPYVERLLCGIAPILFAALAVWSCLYLMYNVCCVALPLSYLWSGCCVALPLS